MPRTYDTCPKCRAFLEPGTGDCPYCGIELRARRPGLWTLFWKRPASHTLLLMILALFGAELYMERAVGVMRDALAALTQPSSLMLDRLGADAYELNVGEGEWWRFLTAIFLHGGIIHLFLNGWALLTLAPLCEEVYGGARFWTVYLLTGIAGNLASLGWCALEGEHFANVGASGALCGLIGLLLVFRRGEGWDAGAESIRRWMWLCLVQIVLFGLLVRRIDNAAHMGGAAAGLLLGLLLGSRRVRRGRGWALFFWRPAAAALAALTVFSFGAMIASQPKWRAAEELVALEERLERAGAALDDYPSGGAEARQAALAELEEMAVMPARDPAAAAARDAFVRAGRLILEEGPSRARAQRRDAERALREARDAFARKHKHVYGLTAETWQDRRAGGRR